MNGHCCFIRLMFITCDLAESDHIKRLLFYSTKTLCKAVNKCLNGNKALKFEK